MSLLRYVINTIHMREGHQYWPSHPNQTQRDAIKDITANYTA